MQKVLPWKGDIKCIDFTSRLRAQFSHYISIPPGIILFILEVEVFSHFDGSYVLEDRRIDDVGNIFFLFLCCIKANRFLVTVRLFSNSSQKTSKCDKNINDTLA